MHHAHADMAAGFCVYNDPAVAIHCLLERGLRVMYVDSDVHHGDGVQQAFYDEDRVLTVSIHESGRYLFPGTGEVSERGRGCGLGYSVNVPLLPYTDDGSYMEVFDTVVPALAASFQPDVVVSQHGCDGHYRDPLSHFSLTTRSFAHVASTVHRLAHELCGGRLVALGGGGYDIWHTVPRAWTILWAALSGRSDELPDQLPASWLAAWRERAAEAGVTLQLDFADDPADLDPPADRDSYISRINREVAAQALKGALALIS